MYANWFMVYNYVVPCADTPLAPKNGPNIACVSAETVQCLRSQNPLGLLIGHRLLMQTHKIIAACIHRLI